MKIDRIKFMNDFTKKRAEIENNAGPQSHYLISRVMGVKEKDLSDLILKGIAPSNPTFVKMCKWNGYKVDRYLL